MTFNTGQGYRVGPENAVDLLIERGYDAREISQRLGVSRWFVIERFGARLIFQEATA